MNPSEVPKATTAPNPEPLESTEEVGLSPEEADARYRIFADNRRSFYDDNAMGSLDGAIADRESTKFQLESTTQNLVNLREDIATRQAEVDKLKSSLISRILNFRQIRELRQQLAYMNNGAESLQSDFIDSQQQLLTYYDRLVAEEETLQRKKEEKELLMTDAEAAEALEEFAGRDVGLLAQEHGVFFVHNFVDAEWKPSANNEVLDTKKLSMVDQYDLLTGLEATISASTVHPSTKQSTFGGKFWGAFLSGG